MLTALLICLAGAPSDDVLAVRSTWATYQKSEGAGVPPIGWVSAKGRFYVDSLSRARATVEVMEFKTKADCAAAFVAPDRFNMQKVTFGNYTWSGVSLGDKCRASRSDGSITLRVAAGRYLFTFDAVYRSELHGVGAEQTRVWLTQTMPRDKQCAEGYARVVLGRLLAGATITGKGDPPKDAVDVSKMTSVRKWAESFGAKPSYDYDTGSVRVHTGKHKVVFPACSRQILVGGKPVDVGEFIVCKDNEWYVPTKALKQIQ
jgi:hypothetical protein